ncbi:response regulator transcription factor [Ensifer sp. MJa1]|uniref:response regulator transcription factor n=1 Tax=Ensifer sp. MJa1 TaxID=2919888 RepID=UPI00300A6FFC
MRLLLVEDELEMAAALRAAPGRYDMILDHAPSLDHALAALANHVHDGIILDRQLPDGDGLSLIPRVRALKSGIPVIVLTARGKRRALHRAPCLRASVSSTRSSRRGQ